MSEDTDSFEEIIAKARAYDPDQDPQLNPGIKKTVKWLRALGYVTVDSGDGETHICGCDLPVPYVHVYFDTPIEAVEESQRIKEDVEAILGAEVWSIHKPDPENPGETYTPSIEVSYSPVDGLAAASLIGITDVMLFGDPSKN